MTKNDAVENDSAREVRSEILDATTVLAASVVKEKARKSTDLGLLEILESTVLRVDAADNAWEKAAEAIGKLATSRAELRMMTP
ncbi:MAG: hypothetical protein JST16_14340 [Bdellovibrionales bacterium]|nr:hypothetical protein [Bdellovibrionales bacterium]